MSPRKQPTSLFKFSVKSCIQLINSTCYVLEKKYAEDELFLCQTLSFKSYLTSMLPARLFDVLCSERTCVQYTGDPRIQLGVLTHPNMTVFHKCDLDNSIPQLFWIEMIPSFTNILVLDLKFICTNEILQVIGQHCRRLQELNIVSRVDIYKSPFNASVLIRNVSDVGLCSITFLKNLRVLAMDPPRNERANRIGRCVSQAGIIMLISELPNLEELKIESCDIGSTLINSSVAIGPLCLKRINYHFVSADGIRKLTTICPKLKEFSIAHISGHNKDAILNQIADSDWRLNKLDVSFFSFSQSMQELLVIKGAYLTQFSLWETENTLNLDAILTIGMYCPNLISLFLMTQSKYLNIPRYHRKTGKIFTQLNTLTLGNENFNIKEILTFFLSCTKNLQKLVLKYQTQVSMDSTMISLLDNGLLNNVSHLWVDCTLELSKEVIIKIIDCCSMLQNLTVCFGDRWKDLQQYIFDHNLDLKLGIY